MRKSIYYSVVVFAILLFAFSKTTYSSGGNNGWSAPMENPKVFIENKGQFHTYNLKEKVLYAYDNGSTMIYFTATGLTYSFVKDMKKDEKENEREREQKELKNGKSHAEMEAEEHKAEYKTDVVNFIWENSNQEVEVIAQNQTEDYHSYCTKEKDGSVKNVNFIRAFKKLIYKNLYPNIDVEYIFHPDKGIKYTLILHPGADISKVKMKYKDDAVKLKLNGDLHIPTLFGDLIDKAPVTFYLDNRFETISSHFINTGSSISFELGTYDHSKTIIVDPWVQTPTLSNSNCVWECEKDGAGNVYIIGGDSPMRLRKYNSTGAVQWTYNTPWDTAGGWLGTFATDLAGNSFVTNGSNAALQKINTSGSMVYNAGGGSLDEYWNIAFNCDQTKLIVGGTRLGIMPPANSHGVIFDINTSNGNVNSVKIVGNSRSHVVFGFTVTDINEVRAITSSRNAKYYFLTLDTIGAIDQNFTTCPNGNLFNINHTYSLGYKCEDYKIKGNSGIMAIRANRNFVYTQNGITIQKRSLSTGAVITSAAIAGGINTASNGLNQVGNAGIDIDSCGNVYVGSGNAVIKYGPNLNVITSVTVPFRVYDVAVSYGGNIIACGATGNASTASRTGYVQSINMSSCDPMVLFCCNAGICPAGPFCTSASPVTLTPVTAGGTWGGAGVNATTGVFSPSVAGPGTHSIVHTLPCGSDSISIIVSCCGAQINPAGPFCIGDAPVNLTAAAPGGTWTGTGITSASAGTFSPPVAGVGSHAVVYTISGCGNDTLTILVSACVSLTACQESNGNITVTNGIGPYTWKKDSTFTDCSSCFGGQCIPGFCAGVPGTTTTTFATGVTVTPPGTYPITVTDASSNSVVITSLSSLPNCSSVCPPLTVTSSNIVMDSCFGQSNGSFSASTSGGVSPWDYTLKLGGVTVSTFSNIAGAQSFTGLAAGVYTLNVLDNNACPGTLTVTITQPTSTVTVAAAGPDQSGCSNSAILAGNVATVGTGLWTIVSGTGTIASPSSPTSIVTGIGVGSTVLQWTITSAPCPSSNDQVTITNTGGGPTVTIASQTNIVPCYGGNGGNATVFATGGTGTLTYLWTPSGGSTVTANNLVPGTYTITVTDGSGCTGVASVTITQPDSIHAQVSTTQTACGVNNGSATVTANGGAGNLTYSWSNGGASTTTITNIGAGIHSVIVTDSLGCTKTVSGTVATTGGPTANAGADVTIISGSSTQLSASGGGTYGWAPPTGLSCDTCRAPIASPLVTTSYCVTVSVSGCSDTACVTVTVADTVSGGCGTLFLPTGSVYVPNAFTPTNNDFLNDVYKPVVNCVHDYSFLIFDRWGEKIFETSDTNEGWNGYYKGKMCESQIYVYKISFIDDTKNDFHQYIGKVTLLK